MLCSVSWLLWNRSSRAVYTSGDIGLFVVVVVPPFFSVVAVVVAPPFVSVVAVAVVVQTLGLPLRFSTN